MGINRTDKLVAGILGLDSLSVAGDLRIRAVEIVVAERPLRHIRGMVHAVGCLLLRCFRGNVWIRGVDGHGERCLVVIETLAEKLREESFSHSGVDRIVVGAAPTGTIRIGIGVLLDGAISIDAAGWSIGVNQLLESREVAVAPAAAFAAACGVGKLFAVEVLGRSGVAVESWSFSLAGMHLLHNERGPDLAVISNLGRIGVLGAGAVGSAIGYILLQASFDVEVIVIDDDVYAEENLDTTLLLERATALKGLPKAKALSSSLSREGLHASAHIERVERGSLILKQPFDSFICAVDNAESRRELDGSQAGLLINAGVGGSSRDAGHVICSKHVAQSQPLSALYPPAIGNQPKVAEEHLPREIRADLCSAVVDQYRGVAMAAPFIALTAASLTVAVAMRHSLGAVSGPLVMKMDVLGIQSMMELRF